MTVRSVLRTLPGLALGAALLGPLVPAPAAAQLATSGAGVPGAPNGRAARTAPNREKAPPALPGARAEPDAVAPPSRNAPDLPPTEALFDAINRGDLPSAKDAINRGADIGGRNVLGLTPLELSVDLGRNQISFLLLSLRGSAGYTTTAGPAASATAPAPHAQTRAERLAAQREERQERLEAAKAAKAERSGSPDEPAAPPPQSPRLFSGGGGAPIPQAGFLGFDSRR